MQLPHMRHNILLAFCALVLLVSTGCEESVDAVLESEQPFTLYGFLNPRADTQAVRVFPIEPVLAPTRPEGLDAEVQSTNLVTGETVEWTNSVVHYADSTFGHVSYALFRPEYGHTYRFEIARSDGATTMVEVPVPLSAMAALGRPKR